MSSSRKWYFIAAVALALAAVLQFINKEWWTAGTFTFAALCFIFAAVRTPPQRR